jgi:hypothetical protein
MQPEHVLCLACLDRRLQRDGGARDRILKGAIPTYAVEPALISALIL